MIRIRCLPDDVDATPAGETTLLDALLAAGVPLAHACGGHARCTTCRVRVEDGAECLGPRTDDERAMAERLRFDDATRLACQATCGGTSVVRRLVLDKRDEQLASRLASDPSRGSVGREEDCTILFADVANFTPLSERLPPYDVIHLLNRYFLQVGDAIERCGGYIDNYMGDGLMAVFKGDGCALAAVRAGLAMLEETADVSEYAEPLYGAPFRIRVGIHHGTVVIGDMGACHKRRETVIGDVVNVASRIEAANKPAGTRLLVSDAVLALVRDDVVTGRIVDTPLKGKTGAHTLVEIVRLADAAASA